MFSLWRFEDQRPNEKIIFVLRRHPIIFLRGFFQIMAVLIIVGIIIYLGLNFNTFLIIILGCLICFAIIIYHWYLWYNDIYLLTDQRLIDVDQKSLFTRVISETSLDQIQDVTAEVSGPLETFFRFGKVIIQTAGAEQNIIIELISRPNEVREQISQAFNNYRTKMGLIQRQEQTKTFSSEKKEFNNEQNLG